MGAICKGTAYSVDVELGQIIINASRRPDVQASVLELYARVEREMAQRKPLCSISGRCCRFEEYGHRLYVTTMELAYFLSQQPGFEQAWDNTGCPYQLKGLCSVHSIRPFGCRIFFCDPTAKEWQEDQYERFHAELKREHERLAVPYRYMEWRAALRAVGLVDS